MAGGVAVGPSVVTKAKNKPQDVYNAAVETGATDYDRMMQGYQQLAAQAKADAAIDASAKVNYTPIAPTLQSSPVGNMYTQGNDMTRALQEYANGAQTGGYTPEGLAAIRARGVSPIRSIYANAQRGIEQNRTIQGGYSPNFNAASTKMAREMSEQLSSANTAIEADIADRVAKGKATSLSGYAQLATESDRMRLGVDAQRAGAVNSVSSQNASASQSANTLNAQMPLEVAKTNATIKSGTQNQAQSALEGQRLLYGTTPGNASLYGSQNLQSQQMAQTAAQQAAALKQQGINSQNQLASSLLGGYQPRFG